MTFDEKRTLLHWLFDGKDMEGTPYSIYVNKNGKGKNSEVDYYMYVRLQGLRTLKGDDINYMGNVDEVLRKELGDNYNTKLIRLKIIY
jgi:hypothetical protein